ncbi:hypothetical protein ACFWBB_36240 [Streptomyces sp. NPDC060000]|uniref:hypothetical protein n=1 Tax=Streptomyces sp. NPDC060000 TaxID=3347031 RepID=UPI0036A8CAE2
MTEHLYDAADIEVLEFDAAVRKRMGMYFGVGRGDPRLPARVLCAVARHALHPATGVAAEHTLRTVVEITGDLSFTMVMDQPHGWNGSNTPALGYYDSLLGPEWWLPAAVAALSERVTVEMWSAGRGFGQDLVGIRPLSGPREFVAPESSGTKVAFVLDPAHVGPDFVLPTDLENLDLHGPYCSAPAGRGHVLIRDLRHGSAGREVMHR